MIRAPRLLLLVGTPLVLAVVLWFHPPGGENIFEDVREDVDAWLAVHRSSCSSSRCSRSPSTCCCAT